MANMLAVLFAVNFIALNHAQRTLQFSNGCDEPIWVGLSADWQEDFPTWWTDESGNPTSEIAVAASQTLTFPSDTYSSMNVWGRTQCDFDTVPTGGIASEYTCCGTGDCECREICQDSSNYVPNQNGPPAGTTQAEITMLQAYDNYDISNINGFNIPIAISPLLPYGPAGIDRLSCQTGGDVFWNKTYLFDAILGNCSNYNSGQNLVYEKANYNGAGLYICPDGLLTVPGPRYCIKGIASDYESANITSDVDLTYMKYKSFCVSDAFVVSEANDITDRPLSWPNNDLHDNYNCPAFNLCTCPANYHCLEDGTEDEWCQYFDCNGDNYGEAPYINWNKMMYNAGFDYSSYLFTYDDPYAGYACNTWLDGEGGGGYGIVFCPANFQNVVNMPGSTEVDGTDGTDGYVLFICLLVPYIASIM